MELPRFSHANICERDGTVPFHQHTGSELLLVTSGHCHVDSDLGMLEGGHGTLFVIPPNVRHNQISLHDERNYFCVFSASPELFTPQWQTMDVTDCHWLWWYFMELTDMTRNNDLAGAPALLCSLLMRLDDASRRSREHDDIHPGLLSAIHYMQKNYQTPITVGDTARKACLSTSLLRQLFKERWGIAPLAYLRNLRLQHGRNLMRNPYLSLEEVAEQCGFSGSNYFIRSYKKRYGRTPGEERTALQQNAGSFGQADDVPFHDIMASSRRRSP